MLIDLVRLVVELLSGFNFLVEIVIIVKGILIYEIVCILVDIVFLGVIKVM